MEGATEYLLFTYDAATDHIEMLGTTTDTTVVMDGLGPGSTHRYIVQPISYVEIADNVSGENSVGATCGGALTAAVTPAVSYDAESGSLTLSWQEMEGVETYYIYRYHPDANMLSTPKTVRGKTSYTYRQGAANSDVSYLVTTEQMSSRKYYDGTGAISVVLPNP